jgi:AmmeMemoRadiSam system protein B/AmmeMemoRadiSam system protein A
MEGEGKDMKTKMPALISALVILTLGLGAQGTRQPVFAGAFYDDDPVRLGAQIDAYLDNVTGLPADAHGLRALICPHAGYVFSGQTAAYAYRLVKGKPFRTVVIVGTSHQYALDGASIYLKGSFVTPLGEVPVDEELAARIAKASGFTYVPEAHAKEHSVEVEVPFVQKALPGAKIVPIVFGDPTRANVYALSKGLEQAAASPDVLIIASTDLSHYLPKEKANAVDAETLELVRKCDSDTLAGRCARGDNIMCGGGGVAATLLALKRLSRPRVEILHYADSSAATGDASKVVGYAAAAVFSGEPVRPVAFALSAEEKADLLRLARESVRQFVEEKKIIEYATQNPSFLSEKGAFVTLKKRGELRGCIGFIEPVFPLYEAIIRGAIYAATQDPRFPAVTPGELKDLEFEISVLTPIVKIDDPRRVEVGRHGLVISQGENRGLLLPQVAVENGWNRETFLDQCCLKAGLPTNAWKKGAEISVFEAIVFH